MKTFEFGEIAALDDNYYSALTISRKPKEMDYLYAMDRAAYYVKLDSPTFNTMASFQLISILSSTPIDVVAGLRVELLMEILCYILNNGK
jgi:hypothetical protein